MRCACLLALILGASAGSQTPVLLGQGPWRHIDPTPDLASAAALGDVDGDGDLDLVIGHFGASSLYLNDGFARFFDVTDSNHRPGKEPTYGMAFADIDGDGDLDLIEANGGITTLAGPNRLYLNDGRGRFTDVTTTHLPQTPAESSSVAVGDIDGDGDLDLFSANRATSVGTGENHLFVNDGQGRFRDVSSTQLPRILDYTLHATFADIDGDGDLDLFTVNSTQGPGFGQNRLLVNDGRGRFADETAARLPAEKEHSMAAGFVDVDRDGDLDLIVVNWRAADGLYVNDGTGRFQRGTLPAVTDEGQAIAIVDVDADGQADVVLGDAVAPDKLLVVDASGRLVDRSSALPSEVGTRGFAAGDVDGDRKPDLIRVTYSELFEPRPNTLWLGDGRGFRAAPASRLPPLVERLDAVAAADVDGDGDTDLFVGTRVGLLGKAVPNYLLRNDGFGSYQVASGALPPPFHVSDAKFADIDRDGDPDLVTVDNRAISFWINAGGRFATSGLVLIPGNACELVDVDGDGDLDLVVAHDQGAALWRGDGRGGFQLATAKLGGLSDPLDVVAVADVEGDGDLDLVFGSSLGVFAAIQRRLLLNDGRGGFGEVPGKLPATGVWTRVLRFGDVDDDGDPDLFSGNVGHALSGKGAKNELFINDGRGNFTEVVRGRTGEDKTNDAVFLDADGDGRLDLVVADGDGSPREPVRLYVGDGQGGFFDRTDLLLHTSGVHPRLLAVDVDRDGDDDVVLLTDGAHRVLVNYSRQLAAPVTAAVGRPFLLRAQRTPGLLARSELALPFVTGRELQPRRATPFGLLGLDPGALVPLHAIAVPAPAGEGDLILSVPNAPRLKGSRVFFQALFVPQPASASWRLSEVLAETVR